MSLTTSSISDSVGLQWDAELQAPADTHVVLCWNGWEHALEIIGQYFMHIIQVDFIYAMLKAELYSI